MTISNIEKCARLMGYEHASVHNIAGDLAVTKNGRQVTATWFNPRTNKADLVDVECHLCLDIEWSHCEQIIEVAHYGTNGDAEDYFYALVNYADHPTKFAARAHAVIAVAVQIYDRREE